MIVEPKASKTLGSWGSAPVKAELELEAWPAIYRARTELQENAFKPMIDHGALNLHVGRKPILGPDRHQQRAEAKVQDSLEAARRRVAKKGLELEAQCEQVAQSEAQGHGKRLEQRQRASTELEAKLREAQQHEAYLQEQVDGFAAPKERAARDMRKQTIMRICTLFLENLLQAFKSELLSILPKKVSLDQVLKLLFERSGAWIETDQMVRYWINATGLSRGHRRILGEIVEGLSAMGLVERDKPVRIGLKALPP